MEYIQSKENELEKIIFSKIKEKNKKINKIEIIEFSLKENFTDRYIPFDKLNNKYLVVLVKYELENKILQNNFNLNLNELFYKDKPTENIFLKIIINKIKEDFFENNFNHNSIKNIELIEFVLHESYYNEFDNNKGKYEGVSINVSFKCSINNIIKEDEYSNNLYFLNCKNEKPIKILEENSITEKTGQ